MKESVNIQNYNLPESKPVTFLVRLFVSVFCILYVGLFSSFSMNTGLPEADYDNSFYFNSVPDTITEKSKDSKTVNTTVVDKKDNKKKQVKLVIDKGEVVKLYVDGKKIPKEEFCKYDHLIDATLAELADLDRELENLDLELAELNKELANFDEEELREEIASAMQSLKEVDCKAIQHEIDKAMQQVQKIDISGIMIDLEKSLIGTTDTSTKKSPEEMEEILENLEKEN